MTRTIKFRAWDKKRKEWIDFFAVKENGKVVIPIGNLHFKELENVGLIQSTGFHDESGKEIYEGDIVKADGKIALVEWNKSEPFYWVRFGGNKFNYLSDVLEIEIIGNIYENPELLTK